MGSRAAGDILGFVAEVFDLVRWAAQIVGVARLVGYRKGGWTVALWRRQKCGRAKPYECFEGYRETVGLGVRWC